MKKNLPGLLSLSIITFLSFSCASSKITLSDGSPMAIITVVGNSYIPWTDDEGAEEGNDASEGLLNSLAHTLLGSKDPEVLTAVDRVDYAEESFRNIVSEVSGTEVLEKADVINVEEYKVLSESFFNSLSATVKATNYKDFSIIGAKKARFLMDSVGAKSLAALSFSFKKERADENNYQKFCRGLVIMKVKIINEEGREIINKVYTEQTNSKVRMYSGSDYDKDALVNLFPDAIDSVITRFALEFMGTPSASKREKNEFSQQAVKLALPPRSADTAKKSAPADSGAAAGKEEKGSVDPRIEAAVKLVQKYNVSPEEAAGDMNIPLEKLLEALKED